jgi:hypoxanthine-guanine phosphoribosyltransferase
MNQVGMLQVVAVERMQIRYPQGLLNLEVSVTEGEVYDYLGFAARANAKRAFLFVSKVLGKHYPVRPARMQEVHEQLARQINGNDGPVVFIGMAETATGLGQGVFEAWQRLHLDRSSMFMHTSRYRTDAAVTLAFEEAHSHAPVVYLTLPIDEDLRTLFESAKTVVLVDDEQSTGRTLLQLVEVLRQVMPSLRQILVSTIADFMGDERREAVERALGPTSAVTSLLRGSWCYEGAPAPSNVVPLVLPAAQAISLKDSGYGRLGRKTPLVLSPVWSAEIATRCQRGKTLVLGTGEFMHAAFVLGRALEAHGCDVRVQSTTRSPILQWGAVSASIHVPDVYGEGVQNYLYNVHPEQYDRILICHEDGAKGAQELALPLGGELIRFMEGDGVHDCSFH